MNNIRKPKHQRPAGKEFIYDQGISLENLEAHINEVHHRRTVELADSEESEEEESREKKSDGEESS